MIFENLNLGSWIILSGFIIFGLSLLLGRRKFKKKKMDIKGQIPINKTLFLIGKLSMFLCWLAMILQAFNINLRFLTIPFGLETISIFLMLGGFLILFISFINLNHAVRFGLPKEKIKLQTKGLYKISRNPMYFTFYMFCIVSVLYTLNPIVIVFSLIAIYVHHQIILAEEKFLEKKFGKKYLNYKKKVRRYL